MITPATLGAIVACAPEGAPRRLAIELVGILTSTASISFGPSTAGACVRTAQVAIDHLESRATSRMGGRLPLRAWRAGLLLRALVARGRPVTHDGGGFLCDDDTGDEPRWYGPIGPRLPANDNANDRREHANQR